MSHSTRQPTLLSMLTQPSTPPATPVKATTPAAQDTSPNRTELEPTPLLLALDMQAERKRLRRRVDSVVTGAGDYDAAEEVEGSAKVEVKEDGEEERQREEADGKEVIIPVKEDLSQLALLGRSVSEGFWNGIEGVRKSVWGIAGWS
ncbi:hypothetical protein SVAN01_03948 [Stagonosporopsis vannaccii]|nr:hypothetical protein SVAN01_03948 [Stagonosporopsis vannaccii]